MWWLLSLNSEVFLNFWLDCENPIQCWENGLWVPRGRICFIFDCICFNEGSLHRHFFCWWSLYWKSLWKCIFYFLCIIIFHKFKTSIAFVKCKVVIFEIGISQTCAVWVLVKNTWEYSVLKIIVYHDGQ